MRYYDEVHGPHKYIVRADLTTRFMTHVARPACTLWMSPDWPPEVLAMVTFAEHEGKTKLTQRHSILKSVEGREGTQQGWTEMLDHLAGDMARA